MAGIGVMVRTKWNRVALGDPIWADAYNSVLPSSGTQMVRGARCRTNVCKEIDWEEGGMVATGDDDSDLRGESVRMSEHCVKVVRVCDVSLAGWSGLGMFLSPV